MSTTPRPLTHDMRHAAESAYQGRPLNPRWSLAAQDIYRGIWNAIHGQDPVSQTASTPSPTITRTPSTHYSQATPFLQKPVQAWHLTYDDGDHVLILFPHHATTEFILHVSKEIAGDKPFTMHPLQYGHFHIQSPTQDTIHSLYSHDIRVMDQHGMLHIPFRLPKRPPPDAT